MNSVVVVVLSFLFFVLPYKTCQLPSPEIVELPFVDEEITICLKDSICLEDPNTIPVYLTPYIESGQFAEARARALVQHDEMGNVLSYSGYLTVNKKYFSNLFFWFFPAERYSDIAPVILWLQGGPGLTSMLSLFAEHGPFIVTEDNTLKKRELSWHKNHSIIYIDSPVGTGFSFTDQQKGNARDAKQVARELHIALEQLFLMFPYLQSNDFFVMGESYAAKYAIALSQAIKKYNMKAKHKPKLDIINLKGLVIVNGFCDPKNQLQYSDYLYPIGLIDLNGKAEFQKAENASRQFIEKNDFLKAFFYYFTIFGLDFNFESSLFYKLTHLYPEYHYLNATLNNDLYYTSLWRFLWWIEKLDVRYAIHVSNNTFRYFNNDMYLYQQEDYLKSVVDLLKDILESEYKVLIYHGQTNIVNSYVLAANYLQKIQWSGAEKFAKAPKKFWIVDDDLAGYTKSADNLTFVLVRNAGRMVSADQPKWALDLISRFVRNKEF